MVPKYRLNWNKITTGEDEEKIEDTMLFTIK